MKIVLAILHKSCGLAHEWRVYWALRLGQSLFCGVCKNDVEPQGNNDLGFNKIQKIKKVYGTKVKLVICFSYKWLQIGKASELGLNENKSFKQY